MKVSTKFFSSGLQFGYRIIDVDIGRSQFLCNSSASAPIDSFARQVSFVVIVLT
jgi:hypothetical protein